MMNRENIKRVRDHLAELSPERFDMEVWGPGPKALRHDCGASACIAGWAQAILSPRSTMDPWWKAERLFELSPEQSADLFLAPGHRDATTSQAVAVLDHLLETGEVDWSVALSHPEEER